MGVGGGAGAHVTGSDRFWRQKGPQRSWRIVAVAGGSEASTDSERVSAHSSHGLSPSRLQPPRRLRRGWGAMLSPGIAASSPPSVGPLSAGPLGPGKWAKSGWKVLSPSGKGMGRKL